MGEERNLQGLLKAYLALAYYCLVEPELEMNYGFCDFFLLDKQRYPDIEHSYMSICCCFNSVAGSEV